MDTALSEVLVFKLFRTEIAADPDGAGWTLSFLHCTSGPRFTSSASRDISDVQSVPHIGLAP
ncbi:hypothetical protein GFK32_22600 [Salmonella enterica subsp. enterica serovar Enteritidis]|nr:hypothetical protein [Salmonella enterica subsp. enterica serovar Enteritidis]